LSLPHGDFLISVDYFLRKYVYSVIIAKFHFVIYFAHPEPLLSCCTVFSIGCDACIMNKPYVALFEIISVHNQALVFLFFTALHFLAINWDVNMSCLQRLCQEFQEA
jgi:hypothetical protein